MQIGFWLSALEYWGILCWWHATRATGTTADDVTAGMQTAFAWPAEEEQGRVLVALKSCVCGHYLLPAALDFACSKSVGFKTKSWGGIPVRCCLWLRRQCFCCFPQFCFLRVPVLKPVLRKACTDRWRSAKPQHLYKEDPEVISRKTADCWLVLWSDLIIYWRSDRECRSESAIIKTRQKKSENDFAGHYFLRGLFVAEKTVEHLQ